MITSNKLSKSEIDTICIVTMLQIALSMVGLIVLGVGVYQDIFNLICIGFSIIVAVLAVELFLRAKYHVDELQKDYEEEEEWSSNDK